MFDRLIDLLIEFIGLFKFWRVIPINKLGVRTRLGKNPIELSAGFHWVIPFEIDHVETCIVQPEWASTTAVHLTTTDLKTVTIAPVVKYRIIDAVAWMYAENDAASNLLEAVRVCTSDVITDSTWEDSRKRPTWTKIKNKLRDKTEDLGIEIQEFGLMDLALSRIYITHV